MLSQPEAHRVERLKWRGKKKNGLVLELEGWKENASTSEQGVQIQTQVKWHGLQRHVFCKWMVKMTRIIFPRLHCCWLCLVRRGMLQRQWNLEKSHSRGRGLAALYSASSPGLRLGQTPWDTGIWSYTTSPELRLYVLQVVLPHFLM